MYRVQFEIRFFKLLVKSRCKQYIFVGKTIDTGKPYSFSGSTVPQKIFVGFLRVLKFYKIIINGDHVKK